MKSGAVSSAGLERVGVPLVGPLASRRVAEHVAPVAILAVAAAVRFWNLPSRGFIYWDEAKFALEGMRMQVAWDLLSGSGGAVTSGKAVGTAKPLHALLIALAYAIFGVRDYAPLFLNAAASCASVLVLYVLVRRVFGDFALALVAALILAVSEFDAVYARSALSESDGNLLFLIGLLVVAPSVARNRPGGRRWLVAGLLFGLAFTVNYRLIVYIAVAGAFLTLWQVTVLRRLPWETLALLPGILVAPVFWQVAGLFASHHGVVLFANELTGWPTTYFSEVAYQLHEGKQAVLHFAPFTYLQWYVVRQGWMDSLLVLVGLIFAFRVRRFGPLLATALIVGPYAVYTFAPFNVPRNLDASMPFASILAATGLVGLVQEFAPRRVARSVVVVATLVLAALGLTLSWRLTSVRSGFAEATVWLRTHDDGRALTSTEIMTFYLGGSRPDCGAPAIPLKKPLLGDYVAAGYTYAVTERHGNAVTYYIDSHGIVVRRFLAEGNVSLGESLISSENGNPPRSTRRRERVTIYWLGTLHLRGDPRYVVPCPPDHVV